MTGVFADLFNEPTAERIGDPESAQPMIRSIAGANNPVSPSSLFIPLIRLKTCPGDRADAWRGANDRSGRHETGATWVDHDHVKPRRERPLGRRVSVRPA